jgi:uncharacterized phage protein gp47/JayE
MGFQIIRAEDRTVRMLQWFGGICRKITDLLPGSKIRTKFESVAVEMEAMDFAFYQAAKKAIPTAIYQAFNFNLLPPEKASSPVLFGAVPAPAADVVIPQGTKVATVGTNTNPEKLYVTTEMATLLAGQTSVLVPIASTVAGSSGNAGIGLITVIKGTVPGITSVTNPAALVNGKDKETETERRSRFIEYIASLRRGTNEAIKAGAKTATVLDTDGSVIEAVVSALVDEEYSLLNGNIACYICNGSGGTSDELAARAQEIIDGYTTSDGTKIGGYKAAGIICTVIKATETAPTVLIAVKAMPNVDQATLKTQVEDAIAAYLDTLEIGQSCLRSEIIQRVKAMTGVYDCTLTTPANNLIAATSEIFTSYGTITATVT